jgi:hypothetical protein
MPKKYNFTKEDLHKKYHVEKKSAFDIANEYSCDHKTIRSWMKKFDIAVKSSSDYNYYCKNTHVSPTFKQLMDPISIAAHMAYLCEGWHTNKTNTLIFCNQDTQLIDLFVDCINQTYKYEGAPKVTVCYNYNCKTSIKKADEYKVLYKNSGQPILESNDKSRKNPILRVRAGGKRLSREFIDNCYVILRNLSTTRTDC